MTTTKSIFGKIGLLTVGISIPLFIISLFLPTFSTHSDPVQGLACLLAGWLSLLMFDTLAWIANPLMFLTWILLLRFSKTKKDIYVRYALLFSMAAMIAGMSFLFVKDLMMDEGGAQYHLTSYHAGYVLWLASAVVLAVGSFIGFLRVRK